MNKRSGKFYYRNEREVMESLGLKQTKGSGNGWIEKEDGQNENVICQLKSTDAQSIKVNQRDIKILEYNADVSKKIPVFAIQFLNDNSLYLIAKVENMQNLAEYLTTGQTNENMFGLTMNVEDIQPKNIKHEIKSSETSRNMFHKERNDKYKKEEKRGRLWE